MAGLACAKEIIDQRNALVQQMDCMNASILLAATEGREPSMQEAEEFRDASNALAAVASRIERKVRKG
jgi:hypothetical protein